MRVFIAECVDKTSIDVASADLGPDHMTNIETPVQKLKCFCNVNEINYEIASDQLRDGTFMSNCKKFYFIRNLLMWERTC